MNYYMNNGSSNAEENNKELNNEIKAVYESLEKRKDGTTRQTISNAIIVLENDPEFKGAIKRNELSCQTDIVKKMDWRRRSKSFRIQILTTFFSVWKRDMELPEIRMLREPLI